MLEDAVSPWASHLSLSLSFISEMTSLDYMTRKVHSGCQLLQSWEGTLSPFDLSAP